MSICDGNNVIGSGVLHFQAHARVDFPGNVSLNFLARAGVPDACAIAGTAGGLEIAVDLQPQESIRGRPTFNLSGASYAAPFTVRRLEDLGAQSFYVVEYTLLAD